LEAPFIIKSNNAFHDISDKVTQELGIPEGKRVFSEWKEWLKTEIKRMSM
jgi:hypothetical protein